MLSQAGGPGNQPGGNAPILEFRKQAGAEATYVMDLVAGAVPPQFQGVFQPTVMLTKDQLVIAATTAGAARRGREQRRRGPALAAHRCVCLSGAKASFQSGAAQRE